ncbi:MAG TPA: FAD-dependent monooxygenase [Candidatus Binataceae bacterium]|nr:FAD-dependent monooxygenase [Candidatus Binataceae bacterium]
MASRLGGHAIVIGGSIGGLVTARVLSDHFERVTILERDHIESRPQVHKSTPQGNHLHTVLLGGLRVLSRLYPGFTDRLHAMGAVPVRMSKDFPVYRPDGVSYSLTGTVKEPHDLGLQLYSQSRGLLEHCIRQFTLAVPNISAECDAPVETLIYRNGRVEGVRYRRAGEPLSLAADLVVDCGGRGSHARRWLPEMGFEAPQETVIGVDFAYSSTKFRIPNYHGEAGLFTLFGGPPPKYTSGGALVLIEDGIWQLSLAGRFGEYPPQDESGFMEFVRNLPTPQLYEIVKDAERVDEITHHRFPTSVLRHYERLGAFPERFIVLGDAISSFNPVYGQGMSSASLQADALAQILERRAAAPNGLDAFAPEFFAKAAEVVSAPWSLAANFDFSYPQTTGERPQMSAEDLRYFLILDALTAEDVEVQKTLVEVFSLARPMSTLWEEPLRSRVNERMHKLDQGQ